MPCCQHKRRRQVCQVSIGVSIGVEVNLKIKIKNIFPQHFNPSSPHHTGTGIICPLKQTKTNGLVYNSWNLE
jgi:hypothetical protein